MGAVKTKADANLVENSNGSITPAKHREVTDVIDNEIEALKEIAIPTIDTSGKLLTYTNKLEWVLPSALQLCEREGFSMIGDIDMNGRELQSARLTASYTNPNTYTSNNIFFEPDAENDVFVSNTTLAYESDLSSKFNERSLIDKGFFDGKVKLLKLSANIPPMAVLPLDFSHPYGDDVPVYQLWKNNQALNVVATISTGSISFPDQDGGTYTLVAYFI